MGAAGKVATAALAGIATAGVGLAAGIGKAIMGAADFQQGIANVGSLVGATDEQMRQLSDAALALGTDITLSGVGATDAAAAMAQLAAAGFSVDDMTNGVTRGVLLLASATGTDVARAAEIAGDTFNAFRKSMGLTAADMPGIADLIVGMANASSIGVEDIGNSMKTIAPVAAAMGISIDDVAAAVAALGNQGIKGSEAGTALRGVLASLADPSKESAGLIKQLGLNFRDSEGRMKDFGGIADELQGKMAGLTQAQREQAIVQLFGRENLAAIMALMSEGSAGLDKFTAAIQAQGNASAIGAQRNNTLRGAFETLLGAAETAGIAFGMGMLPALQQFTQRISSAVSAMVPFITMLGQRLGAALAAAIGLFQRFAAYIGSAITAVVDAFNKLRGGEITISQFIGGIKNMIATVVGDLAGVGGQAGAALSSFGPAILNALRVAMPIIANELAILGRAFGDWVNTTALPWLMPRLAALWAALSGWITGTLLPAAGTALVTLGQKFGAWVTETAIPYLQANLPLWSAALGNWLASTAIPAAVGWLVKLGQAFGTWVTTTAIPFLQANLPLWLAAASNYLTGTVLPSLIALLRPIGEAFGKWVTETAIPFLQANLPLWLAALGNWLTGTALPAIGGFLVMVGQKFGTWITETAIPFLQANLPIWLAALGNWITGTAAPAVGAFLVKVGQAMGEWVTDTAVPWLQQKLPEWGDALRNWILNDGLPQAIEALTQMGEKFGDWITDTAIPWVEAKLPEWADAISNFITGTAAPFIAEKAGEIGRQMVEKLVEMAQDAPDKIGEIFGRVREALTSALAQAVVGAAIQMALFVGKILIALAGLAITALVAATTVGNNIRNGIINALGNAATALYQKGVDLVQGLINGINSMIGSAKEKAAELASAVAGAVSGALGIKSPSRVTMEMGREIINGLVKGMGDKEQEATKKAAEVASAVAKAVTDVLAASRALAGFKSGDAPSGEQLAWFAEMVDAMLGTMSAVAGRFEAKALEHTDKFADTLGKVGGAIKNAVEGLLLLGKTDWANASPDGHALAWFAHLAASLVANFAEAAMRFESGAIESASAFADAAGKVGGSVANALGGLQALARADWASSSPDGHAMAWFTHLIASLVRNFADAAATFGEGALASANAFAETAGKVGGAVSGALAGLKALASASWAESSPDGSAMGWFTHLVASLVRNFADAARLFEADALASASAFAEAVGAVTGSIAGAIAGLAALDDFVAPVEGRVSAFMVALADLMEKFGTWASGFEADSLAHATLFAEAAGTVTGILKGGVEGLMGLAKFAAPAEADVSAFMASLADLVERFGTWAGGFEADALGHAATFAESAGKVVGILKPGVDGLAAIATLVAPSEAAVERFLAGIRYVIGRFAAMATILDGDGVTHMGAFAEAAGRALGAAKTGTDLFLAFKDLVIPSAEAIDALMEGIKYVVRRFHEMAGTLASEGVPQLAAFAESAGKALGAAKAGTDLFNGMKDLAIPSSKAIDNLLLGIAYVIQKTREIAANIGTEGLREAQSFANGAGEVFAAIKGGLQSFDDMAEYEGIPKAALEGAWNALTAALEWARKNVTLATSLKGEGQKFRDEMAAAARLFAEGLSLSAGATAPGGGAGWTYAPGAPGGGGGGKTSNVTVNNPILLGRDSIVTQKLANLVTAGQNKVVGYSV